jgi:hypothetical protein
MKTKTITVTLKLPDSEDALLAGLGTVYDVMPSLRDVERRPGEAKERLAAAEAEAARRQQEVEHLVREVAAGRARHETLARAVVDARAAELLLPAHRQQITDAEDDVATAAAAANDALHAEHQVRLNLLSAALADIERTRAMLEELVGTLVVHHHNTVIQRDLAIADMNGVARHQLKRAEQP